MLCTETINRLLNKTLNGVASKNSSYQRHALLNICVTHDYHANQILNHPCIQHKADIVP